MIMNKIVYIAVCLLFMTACAQDEVFNYAHENESIQFDGAETDLTKSLNFFTSGLEKDSLFLTLSLIGQPSDVDREFFLKLEVDEENAEVADLIKIDNPYIFKAGKISQKIGLEIKKPAEMGSNFKLYIVIDATAEGSSFEQGVIEQQKFLLFVQNKIGKPDLWSNFQFAYGSYSDEKYEFMIDVFGNVDFFNYDTYYLYQYELWDALDEYNATHDPDKPFNFWS